MAQMFANGEEYFLKASWNSLVFPSFLKVWREETRQISNERLLQSDGASIKKAATS